MNAQKNMVVYHIYACSNGNSVFRVCSGSRRQAAAADAVGNQTVGKQAGNQASRQASRQAGRQAGGQAAEQADR